MRIYSCLEKEKSMKTKMSRERQHKPVKQRNTHQTKSDKNKIQNKTEIKWTKHKQAQQIPNTKTRVSIQSEEPLKEDSEEQAVHIIPH